MKIGYKNKKLQDLCQKRAVADRKLGADCARKLMLRPHPLKGDRDGEFALDLAGGWRLTFVSAHDPCPTKLDGSIDWAQVTIVTIEYIGDYHD